MIDRSIPLRGKGQIHGCISQTSAEINQSISLLKIENQTASYIVLKYTAYNDTIGINYKTTY